MELWHDPWCSTRLSIGDRLILRWDGNAGIPFPMKQGNAPSSRDEEGNTGLYLSCGGSLSVPLEWIRVCRGLLELHQAFQGPFRGSRGKVGFLSRCCSRKGPHLTLRAKSPGFYRVAAGNLGFSQITMGTSGTRLYCFRKVQSPCEL